MVKLGDLTHPSVEGFWAFIEEREHVRLRKEKWPDALWNWTDDPTLAKYHFCNVRRADDHGTKWYMERIGNQQRVDDSRSNSQLLWQTCLYRLVNNTAWFERLQPDGFIRPDIIYTPDWRERIKEAGTPSNKAYRNLTSSKNPTWTRSRRLRDYIQRTAKAGWHVPFTNAVQDATTPEEAWKALQVFPGIGAFSGLQVYRDLLLAGALPFAEDDWTYIGPGADEGIYLLMDAEGDVTKYDLPLSYEARYEWLQELHASSANTLNLVLGDVEHCMCEYVKWNKFRQGRGKMRRYEPHAKR